MKRRLRRFLLIGILITLVDLGLVLLLGGWWGNRWVLADLAAVIAAAGLSYVAHRLVTFQDDAYSRIDHRPLIFAAAVAPALATDVATVGVFDLGSDLDPPAVVAVKLLAVSLASVVRLFTYRGVLFAAVRSEQDRRPVIQADVAGPRVSIVFPAYEAEAIVADAVHTVRSELAAIGVAPSDVEVVVADDGSRDATSQVAREAGADVVVTLEENRGKGAAVRAGMLAASGRTRIFTDVDLAYPPHQLGELVERLEEGWEVVVGSRRHPDTSQINSASAIREVGSLLFNVITHLVLLGRYRDTQCGLKGFSQSAAESIFAVAQVDGFAFDVEVLHLAERMHLSLLEVPVVLDHVEASTVRLLPQALKMLADVLSVRRRSATGGYGISELESS
ncbi:MAG: glycosyltransferase [Actinomycetota bacterium]|jgi:dolichyl-phosphate beta-glucosyltransferase|nr:glycosyltransferase [Actinomycetota bacterium]